MLKEQIDSDLKNAMREKQQTTLDTLRMLRSRIKNEEIAKQKEFDDAEISAIISSEIKRRRDSIEAYTQGGRAELAAKESEEVALLQKYLPEQLSEEEVAKMIDETLSGQNLTAADFGKAMGMLMPKLKGKADGNVISKLLKEKLK
jgi:uncharacterized protein YqeY